MSFEPTAVASSAALRLKRVQTAAEGTPKQKADFRRQQFNWALLQDMHDANYTGKKAGRSQVHAWFVFDQECVAANHAAGRSPNRRVW